MTLYNIQSHCIDLDKVSSIGRTDNKGYFLEICVPGKSHMFQYADMENRDYYFHQVLQKWKGGEVR